MQIAITGATGFIGKRLVQHYENAGAVVHILSRKAPPDTQEGVSIYNLDLANCSSEELIPFLDGCDIVYHCAAELHDDCKMAQVNEEGTKKLFHAAKGRVGRWVQLSSVGVYGRPRFGVVDEAHVTDPQSPYEKSKLAADEWLINESAIASMALTIVRPSIVFAQDMPNQSLFQLVQKVQRGQFVYIGSRDAQMNYVHADNVLAALVLCGHHAKTVGQTYIVSDHLTIGEFVDVLADQLKCARPWLVVPEFAARALAAVFGGVPSFPLTASRIDAMTNRCIFSDEHIREQLGFTPQVTVEQGLRQLAAYFLSSKYQTANPSIA